jgi:ubiquinol-cytochrome c reductase cytochrome b subunit
VNLIWRWLDERVDLTSLKRNLLDREVPDRLTWWHTLGSATLTAFLIQVLTGIVLATYYSASPDHAYESIQFIDRQVASGALLRAIHHWGASAMFVLVVAHMIRVFSVGAYKFPREVNWLLGVGLFIVVVGFSFTGYLLPWDQKAYWATAVGTNIAGTTPVIGAWVATALRGGEELGAATLSRFFAFHVLWLPVGLVVLVFLHVALVIRNGIAPRPAALEVGSPRRTDDPAYKAFYKGAYAATKLGGVRFWPDIVGKDAIVSCGVVVLIVVIALAVGAPLEPPADPTDLSYVPRPEWYFLPLYQMLKLVPGSMESWVAVGVPSVLILVLLGLPLLDRRSTRNLLYRPLAASGLVVILAGSGFLIGQAVRQQAPVVAPETGRLLNATERAGRALFQSQQCEGCHMVAGHGGDEGPDLSKVGLRHSAAWLHSFVEDPGRFHVRTRMPSYGPPALTHQEIEEITRYLASLRGGAGVDVPPAFQDTFPEARKATEPAKK